MMGLGKSLIRKGERLTRKREGGREESRHRRGAYEVPGTDNCSICFVQNFPLCVRWANP